MCATIIGTPALCAVLMAKGGCTVFFRNIKVVEYRESHLRPFLFTEFLQSPWSSLVHSHLQFSPQVSFLAGAARFRFKMSWYFMEFMMPCIPTRLPGLLEEKQPHNITEPPLPPPPNLHTGYFWYRHSSFYAKPTLSVGCWAWPLNMVPVKVPVAFSKLQVLMFVVKGQQSFILACLPKYLLAWRWCLMLVLETSWPKMLLSSVILQQWSLGNFFTLLSSSLCVGAK